MLGYAITSMETETYRPARLIPVGEGASPELRRSTSLDSLVLPESPPFFVWHTAADPYVPPEHTYRFASALAASQVPHAAHVFAHGPTEPISVISSPSRIHAVPSYVSLAYACSSAICLRAAATSSSFVFA